MGQQGQYRQQGQQGLQKMSDGQDRQKERRSRIMACLGRFPEKIAPEPVVLDSREQDGCRIMRVSYRVEADERIEAYLLIPCKGNGKGNGTGDETGERAAGGETGKKFPAILASHQHGGQYYLGKSEPAGFSRDAMYHYGRELCRRGYVVLCPDHLCFEDRRPEEFRRVDNRNLDGGNYERFMFCKFLLQGSTLQAKYLSDLQRGLDFLESLPEVDPDRIGAIGHSLGGQETLWITWLDPRIRAAVSSCGFSTIKSIIREGINHNFAMFMPGFLDTGDIGDVLCDIAPRPFMMTNGEADAIFPLDGVREIAAMAGEQYRRMGRPDHFRSVVFPGEHAFPPQIREQAYAWLDRHLKG